MSCSNLRPCHPVCTPLRAAVCTFGSFRVDHMRFDTRKSSLQAPSSSRYLQDCCVLYCPTLSCPVLPFLPFPLHTSLFPVAASSRSEDTFCCTKMHSEESDPAMFCALCWFSAWNLPLGDLVWKRELTSFRVPCDHGCVRCIRHRYGVLCDTEFGSHLGEGNICTFSCLSDQSQKSLGTHQSKTVSHGTH
jgi:hypothetical protein